ncbi:MAG TPA: histidine phosphotransferase, partial [Amaricoccus sp.]|nr:histidine phosphotransferase [Amaricoccus sp.]
MSAPDLSALVSARLCHDLISPMGAIRNGMELLQMAPGEAQSPEHALIADSLETALAKLRYFRLAF